MLGGNIQFRTASEQARDIHVLLIQGLGKPQANHAMTVEDMLEAVVRKMSESDSTASARTAI